MSEHEAAEEEDHERAAFRAQARSWLDAHAVPRGADGDFSASHLFSAKTLEEFSLREAEAFGKAIDWQRQLCAGGWAGLSWPEDQGGRALPAWTEEVFAEEHARYGVSTKVLSVGLQMAASVLRQHGTLDQQARYLRPILHAEEIWCQLFSEPDAGSDLASLKTRAAPHADGWVLSGQKVWTSGASMSQLGLMLARSDPTSSGRRGLSCFIVPMDAEGIEVRPLREMSGAYHFNEVFVSDVVVGRDALIGVEGDGWSVARTMLSSERGAIGGGTSARSIKELVMTLQKHCSAEKRTDPVVRQQVARAFIRESILDAFGQRLQAGQGGPGGPSIAKLLYSEHARITSAFAMDLLAMASIAGEDAWAASWQDRFLFSPGLRLGGGTDEIQRNIIAERGLGLPREILGQ
jgi:alkylation response protein AidB-like acyl-CoA dehydrogenase